MLAAAGRGAGRACAGAAFLIGTAIVGDVAAELYISADVEDTDKLLSHAHKLAKLLRGRWFCADCARQGRDHSLACHA